MNVRGDTGAIPTASKCMFRTKPIGNETKLTLTDDTGPFWIGPNSTHGHASSSHLDRPTLP